MYDVGVWWHDLPSSFHQIYVITFTNVFNLIFSAIGQIMLYLDGMNGVIEHNETIQWLYSLIDIQVRTFALSNRKYDLATGGRFMKQLVGGFHQIIFFSPTIVLSPPIFQASDCLNLVRVDSYRWTNVHETPPVPATDTFGSLFKH